MYGNYRNELKRILWTNTNGNIEEEGILSMKEIPDILI